MEQKIISCCKLPWNNNTVKNIVSWCMCKLMKINGSCVLWLNQVHVFIWTICMLSLRNYIIQDSWEIILLWYQTIKPLPYWWFFKILENSLPYCQLKVRQIWSGIFCEKLFTKSLIVPAWDKVKFWYRQAQPLKIKILWTDSCWKRMVLL